MVTPTSVDAASGRIRSHDQFHAAIKATRERFSRIREKHPDLETYLVLSLAGGQTGPGSSAKEILKDSPAHLVIDQAKDGLVAFLKTPELGLNSREPIDASEPLGPRCLFHAAAPSEGCFKAMPVAFYHR